MALLSIAYVFVHREKRHQASRLRHERKRGEGSVPPGWHHSRSSASGMRVYTRTRNSCFIIKNIALKRTRYLYLHTLSVSVVRKAGPRAFVPIALRLTSNTPSQKQHPARDICSGGAVPHPHHLMFVHAHIPFFFLCQHSRTQ